VQDVIWIQDEVVIAIHHQQLTEHGGLEGIRDEGLLQSALCRPKNLLAYTDSALDLADLAAAYGYGIVKNHPFVDGNKRTAYIVMRTFLKLNGHDLQASDEDKYQIWIDLATGILSEIELAEWIRNHVELNRV
jgi:death on curing protein